MRTIEQHQKDDQFSTQYNIVYPLPQNGDLKMCDTRKELNRLTISRNDFDKCLEFLSELTSQEYGTIIYESLLLSAIVFYARPFSCNEKRNASKAESRIDLAVVDQLNEEEQQLHDRLLELRNKAIAHAEWTFHPTGVTESKIIQSMPFSVWKDFRGRAEIDAFLRLVQKVLLRAHHVTADKLRTLS